MNESQLEAFNTILSHGFSEEEAKKLALKHSPRDVQKADEFFHRKTSHTNKQLAKNKDPMGYFLRILVKKNWEFSKA